MDCIILAGGLGTRLRPVVPNLPKALALIQGTPFLELMIRYLMSSGEVTKITLALGYLADQVVRAFRNSHYPLDYSYEERPLGTGGAMKKALLKTKSSPVLVLNGDTYVDVSLKDLLHFHEKKQADATIVYQEVEDAHRFGTLKIASNGRIQAFNEKSNSNKGYINCGVYLLNRNLFQNLPFGESFSIEKEAFPYLLNRRVFGFPSTGLFIDIGTPESYSQSQELLKTIL